MNDLSHRLTQTNTDLSCHFRSVFVCVSLWLKVLRSREVTRVVERQHAHEAVIT